MGTPPRLTAVVLVAVAAALLVTGCTSGDPTPRPTVRPTAVALAAASPTASPEAVPTCDATRAPTSHLRDGLLRMEEVVSSESVGDEAYSIMDLDPGGCQATAEVATQAEFSIEYPRCDEALFPWFDPLYQYVAYAQLRVRHIRQAQLSEVTEQVLEFIDEHDPNITALVNRPRRCQFVRERAEHRIWRGPNGSRVATVQVGRRVLVLTFYDHAILTARDRVRVLQRAVAHLKELP